MYLPYLMEVTFLANTLYIMSLLQNVGAVH
jgi:hypothetical protein